MNGKIHKFATISHRQRKVLKVRLDESRTAAVVLGDIRAVEAKVSSLMRNQNVLASASGTMRTLLSSVRYEREAEVRHWSLS